MATELTRRNFLKASALAAAATVVSGCTPALQRREYLESYIQPPEEGLPGENLWYASTCRECLAGCGTIVRSSEGRARKVEGNPLHPLNEGRLCARGQAALQDLWDPDRLKNAVRQVERGTQSFEPLYWEDALALLGTQLQSADPASIAFLGGNLTTHLWQIIRRFTDALGARTPVVYTLGDELSGQRTQLDASERLFGTAALPVFDIGRSDLVFSFGANFTETWLSPVYYGRAFGRMRRGRLGQRGTLVQFEPRLSSTAAIADRWVPLTPGTEGLVALALGKLVAEQGGVTAVREPALYEPIDVGAVAEASGVPAEELEILATIFADATSPVAMPGSGVTNQPHASEALAAVQALNALTGRLGRPGGVYLSAPAPAEDFEPAPLSTYAELAALVDDMEAGRVQLLLVHGGDPVFTTPAAQGFVDALANVPFVVSFSSNVDETSAQADLILPDHTTMESWGYHTPALTDRTAVSSLQPVMRPLFDTRASVDVFLALARDLGGQLAQALPWPNELDFVQETVLQLKPGSMSDQAFWSEWRRRGGQWSESQDWQAPSASGDFAAAATLASADHESHDEEFPFYLHLYPSIALFDGRGANKSWLQETPDPMTTVAWQTWVEIDSHAAEELGVEDNDIVKVISPAGEVQAIVYTYPGTGDHVVAMPIGRGHAHYGRYAAGMGSNPVRILVPDLDEGTGGLAWGATRVRIEPTGDKKELARLESPEGVEYMLEGH